VRQQPGPQPQLLDSATRLALSAYFSRTVSRIWSDEAASTFTLIGIAFLS
jgi:hypothetical protein